MSLKTATFEYDEWPKGVWVEAHNRPERLFVKVGTVVLEYAWDRLEECFINPRRLPPDGYEIERVWRVAGTLNIHGTRAAAIDLAWRMKDARDGQPERGE